VRSAAALVAETPRTIVEANVAALRVASSLHRMLVVGTSEANRASYRSEQAVEQSNDLAAGAESRAIEFGAQTLLMARTPKDHPDIIHVRVAKNRRMRPGEFWLRLDRERHALAECGNPEADPATASAKVEGKRAGKRAATRAEVEADAHAVLPVVVEAPGIGSRRLRAALKVRGLAMGVPRLDAAVLYLISTGRIENRPETHGQRVDPHYHAVATSEEDARVS
jgi:hypothetical protein